MEGAYAIDSGILKSFSEQQLVDCVKKDNGCNGGEMIDAFEYVSKNPVCSEDEDPYKAKDSNVLPVILRLNLVVVKLFLKIIN